MSDDRYERGRAVRRAVLGEAHVARSEANATEFDAPFQRFITETAWGALWASDTLDRPTRSLITVAILAALGRHEELALHLRGAVNNGLSPEQIREALMHVAVYAGVPAANSAVALAKRVLAEAPPAGPAEEQP